MAISNNSTGLRPGVCTSSTRPTAPYEGQMIYETNTDLSYVYGGSAWQQIAGGTAVGNSGLVYITSLTVSGASTASINNCFSSTYENYQITITGYNPSTASYPLIRMRNAGTDKTATDYYYTLGGYYTNGAANNTQATAASYFENGMYSDSANVEISSGKMDAFAPFRTQRTFFLTHAVLYASQFGYRTGMAEVNDLISYDGFTVLANTGTYSAVITVYGYRKA